MGKFIKNFKWTKLTVALSILVVLIVICFSLFLYYKSSLNAISDNKEPERFQIVEGDTVSSVSERLEKDGFIRNADMAKLSARFNGVNDFAIGTYTIQRNWNTPKMLKHLSNAKNLINDEVLLTFREGIWAKDIAKNIEKYTNVKAKDLLALWNDETFLKQCIERYEFLSDDILNSEYRVKLEGYLFPNTYYFKTKTTAEEVTYTFLNQFEVEYQSIKADITSSGMNVHELITLASVVQYESSTPEDMKKVAGVFFNRLAADQKLESSVTVCYALYEFDDWTECEKKFTIDSPYNTYVNKGLPIGPILNPGKVAIEATLKPDKHDYFYFLADVQGDGTVYYAKTFAEHQKNVDKYLDY